MKGRIKAGIALVFIGLILFLGFAGHEELTPGATLETKVVELVICIVLIALGTLLAGGERA